MQCLPKRKKRTPANENTWPSSVSATSAPAELATRRARPSSAYRKQIVDCGKMPPGPLQLRRWVFCLLCGMYDEDPTVFRNSTVMPLIGTARFGVFVIRRNAGLLRYLTPFFTFARTAKLLFSSHKIKYLKTFIILRRT